MSSGSFLVFTKQSNNFIDECAANTRRLRFYKITARWDFQGGSPLRTPVATGIDHIGYHNVRMFLTATVWLDAMHMHTCTRGVLVPNQLPVSILKWLVIWQSEVGCDWLLHIMYVYSKEAPLRGI